MHAAIVELDALSNAVWPAAQHNDLLFIGYLAFIGTSFFECAVEIRCFCFELCAAGIHHLVHPADTGGFSFLIYFFLTSILYDACDLLVAEAMDLCLAQ